jgi:5-methyltetrahydropteroyltriglutamate--homocysteine methyltransferase
MVLTASFGSYPRPDALREYQIKTYGKQKKIDHVATKDDERMLIEATKQVVEDQTGLGIITDGMLTWDDYLASVTAGWSGIKMGGLIRFYDNNTYYRRPTIIGPVENKKPSLKGNLELLKGLNPGSKVKAIVPGPYTLYDLSEDKFYNDPEAAIKAYSKAIEAEVRELKADFIQIDEPSISYNLDRQLFPLVKDELKKIAKAANGKTIITTYFGDLSLCMREVVELQDTKADYIGVDCVSFKNNYESVVRSGLKNLQLGLLDARNTKVDNEILIRDRIEMIGSDKLIISTNCGLEFLPRKYALRKLELLSMLSNE